MLKTCLGNRSVGWHPEERNKTSQSQLMNIARKMTMSFQLMHTTKARAVLRMSRVEKARETRQGEWISRRRKTELTKCSRSRVRIKSLRLSSQKMKKRRTKKNRQKDVQLVRTWSHAKCILSISRLSALLQIELKNRLQSPHKS